jgi:hypothetical protein
MRLLEEAAVPIMTPLVHGKRTSLSASDQKTLATWITMMAAVGEHLTPDKIMFPADFRRSFAENEVVPKSFSIWLGHFEGYEWRFKYKKTCGTLHRNFSGENRPLSQISRDVSERPNVVSSTFAIGHMYAHFFACDLPEIVSSTARHSTMCP